jgi:thymidylate synthase (FAD)
MKAELINYMGDDLSVVNAARVSFDKMSEWQLDLYEDVWALRDEDARLIQYLAKHGHWTPFAHTAITFRVSAPVPIRTQCFKHKVGFTENEESRRYISSRPELFVPDEFREKADKVKQGSGERHEYSEEWLFRYQRRCTDMILLYEEMIEDGVCPEQARFVLPQGVLVNWMWTGNLASYARFYNQRTDPHAQQEVADLADLIGEQIARLFPVSWKALTNG